MTNCNSIFETYNDDTLNALYQINIEAKRFAKKASNSYKNNRKGYARIYSLKKRALYNLKQSILEEIVSNNLADFRR